MSALKNHLLIASALVFLLSGCVMNTASSRSSRPEDWILATKPVPNSAVDLSGTYRAAGQNRGVKNQDGSAFLGDLFFEKSELSGTPREVQLIQRDRTTLEITLHGDSGILGHKTIVLASSPESGSASLPTKNASFARSEGLMALAGTTSISLIKGTDGFLYAHFEIARAGVVMGIIPMVQSDEGWVRWAPVTPPARPGA